MPKERKSQQVILRRERAKQELHAAPLRQAKNFFTVGPYTPQTCPYYVHNIVSVKLLHLFLFAISNLLKNVQLHIYLHWAMKRAALTIAQLPRVRSGKAAILSGCNSLVAASKRLFGVSSACVLLHVPKFGAMKW